MAQKRKLQVFISSTYTDLIEERQTAIEAILTSGHIPAGMESFAGRNEEHMNIIKQWIDESDIFLLLLGGRYGTVEENSGKSYTHLEFDYAKEKGKTIFAVVADDRFIDQKARDKGPDSVMELKNREKYTSFKEAITAKFVKPWNSKESLQLAIITTLHVLDRDEKLVGWIPGSEATNPVMAEEFFRLSKENADLRLQLSQSPKDSSTYNGLDFTETHVYLNSEYLDSSKFKPLYFSALNSINQINGNSGKVSLVNFFSLWYAFNSSHKITYYNDVINDRYIYHLLSKLIEVGLIKEIMESSTWGTVPNPVGTGSYTITEAGVRFILRLKTIYDSKEIPTVVSKLKQGTGDTHFDPFY
ncbi:MAG: hypothetical protein JWP57_847 [Spirosoma sp.]|nr:hypothetical protein [Spirosoma sp.]